MPGRQRLSILAEATYHPKNVNSCLAETGHAECNTVSLSDIRICMNAFEEALTCRRTARADSPLSSSVCCLDYRMVIFRHAGSETLTTSAIVCQLGHNRHSLDCSGLQALDRFW